MDVVTSFYDNLAETMEFLKVLKTKFPYNSSSNNNNSHRNNNNNYK